MKLSIITVNYHSWSHLEAALVGLKEGFPEDWEIIVVDNASAAEPFAEFSARFPWVTFIGNPNNSGFGAGCNIGVAAATGEQLLFMNPDVIAASSSIQALIDIKAEHNIGIAAPKQMSTDGNRQKVFDDFPNLLNQSKTLKSLSRILLPSRFADPRADYEEIIYCDWVTGSVLLIDRADFDAIGGWAEDYWMYVEDADLCRSARNLGLTVAYVPQVQVIHAHGGSSRLNVDVKSMTKLEVIISKHVYANRHTAGLERGLTHVLIILLRLPMLVFSSLLNWMTLRRYPALRVRSGILAGLVKYYYDVLRTGSWLSPRAIANQASSDSPIAATLIVGPSWVGDMVMAQSLFKLLKSREPDRELDVLAPEWSLPVTARMPEIRNSTASKTAHNEIGLATRRRIARSLEGNGYDRAIVLPRSAKAALIPWFARIPTRTGFRGETRYGFINDMRPFDPEELDQTVKRFVALGLDKDEPLPDVLPEPELTVSAENQAQLMRDLEIGTDKPVIAMMPGAEYGPAKCWPHAHFTTLAAALDDAGYDVWILGSSKDRSVGDVIAGGSRAVNLCGKTTIDDAIDLFAACEQAVSNDSGLMHVAAASGCHVHGIYGSSSSKFTPPLTKKRDIHEIGIECSPCFARECPLGHLKCLTDLDPTQIFEKIVKRSV